MLGGVKSPVRDNEGLTTNTRVAPQKKKRAKFVIYLFFSRFCSVQLHDVGLGWDF